MWKNNLISPSFIPPTHIYAISPFTHSKTEEPVVSGPTAYYGNFKLRISHFPLFLGHLSPSQCCSQDFSRKFCWLVVPLRQHCPQSQHMAVKEHSCAKSASQKRRKQRKSSERHQELTGKVKR